MDSDDSEGASGLPLKLPSRATVRRVEDSDDEETVFAEERRDSAQPDGDTEEATPTMRDSTDQLRNSPELTYIADTYRAVWNEFYEWEPTHCLDALQSLAVPSPHFIGSPADWGLSDDADDADDIGMYWDSSVSEGHAKEDASTSGSEQFDVWEFESDEVYRHGVTAPPVNIVPEEMVTPHPRYQACAPTNCSIDPEIDARQTECQFIKYAGEEGFDDWTYLTHFTSVKWQQPWRDPDHRVIAYTTIRRLTAWEEDGIETPFQVYVDDIDASGIFHQYQHRSLSYVEKSSVLAMLHKLRQRDELPWPGDIFGKGSVYTYQPTWRDPDQQRSYGTIEAMSASFCPHLSCLTASCFTHPYPTGWVPSSLIAHQVSNEELLKDNKTRHKPCGDKCYFVLNSPEIQEAIDWNKEPDVETIDIIISLAADVLPCSLKTLLPLTDCYKIFARRCQTVHEENPWAHVVQKVPKQFVDDNNSIESFTLPARCSHEGPCSKETHCECFRENVHCQLNCQCDPKCKLRFKGCTCSHDSCGSHLDLSSSYCRCVASHRECEIDLCRHTGGRSIKKKGAWKHICRNFAMQRPTSADLVVRAAKYGLGTFAGQNIHKGTFLGEYVGELMWSDSHGIQEMEQKHTNLNYTFTVNNTQNIDAFNAGNETRYLNHAKGDEANVEASISIVNGHQRIGFFARKQIRNSTELLLDYGEDYWKHK
ncbi:SET domain-containing protein [Trametopsis cervina]|nr:SET domain-containing protein [Trametopsis cervina]